MAISGAMQQLAPGVLVNSVSTRIDPMSQRSYIDLELLVDPNQIDVFTHIINGLRKLMNPAHTYAMTSASISPNFVQIPVVEMDEETPEEALVNGHEPTSLEQLRDELRERLDGIDQALRLLVDP